MSDLLSPGSTAATATEVLAKVLIAGIENPSDAENWKQAAVYAFEWKHSHVLQLLFQSQVSMFAVAESVNADAGVQK